jgi:hypothetical protein
MSCHLMFASLADLSFLSSASPFSNGSSSFLYWDFTPPLNGCYSSIGSIFRQKNELWPWFSTGQYWAKYHQVAVSQDTTTLSCLIASFIGHGDVNCESWSWRPASWTSQLVGTGPKDSFSLPNGHEFALAGGWRLRNLPDFCLTQWAKPRLWGIVANPTRWVLGLRRHPLGT